MKRSVLLALTIFFGLSFSSKAQSIEVKKETSNSINEFANSIRNIEVFNELENCCIGVRLFECGTIVGSFPGEEAKEFLLYDLYVSIKQLDEKTRKSPTGYFWVEGKFHNPRDYKFESPENRLTFFHGTDKYPIKISMILSSNNIQIE